MSKGKQGKSGAKGSGSSGAGSTAAASGGAAGSGGGGIASATQSVCAEAGKALPKFGYWLGSLFCQCVSSGTKISRTLSIVFGLAEGLFDIIVGAEVLREAGDASLALTVIGIVSIACGSLAVLGFLIVCSGQVSFPFSVSEKRMTALLTYSPLLSDIGDLFLLSVTLVRINGVCDDINEADIFALVFLVVSPTYSNIVRRYGLKDNGISFSADTSPEYLRKHLGELVIGFFLIPGVFVIVYALEGLQDILTYVAALSGVAAIILWGILLKLLQCCANRQVSHLETGVILGRVNYDTLCIIPWALVIGLSVLLAFEVTISGTCNPLITYLAYALYNASTLGFFILRGVYSGSFFEANWVKKYGKEPSTVASEV